VRIRLRGLLWGLRHVLAVIAEVRLALGNVGSFQHDGRWVRMRSRKEAAFAIELLRAGVRWEYAPRIGPIRRADFRLPNHGGVLIEVYSGRGELRKSALPNCCVMSWIQSRLGSCSTD